MSLIHKCDYSQCHEKAWFSVTYNPNQVPVETCSMHLCWPIGLGFGDAYVIDFKIERFRRESD